MNKATLLRLCSAVVALAAVALIGGGGPASAKPTHAKAKVATIEMGQEGRDLFFNGPPTVAAGAKLKIKNFTDPRQVGPHTFSLAKKSEFPTTNQQVKACAKKLKGICGAIAEWHEFDPQTEEINENPVEVGKQGWDREGNLKRKGDSWYTEKENQSFSREVTAKPGTTLHFICAVHPEMQGKIKVVAG